MKTTKTRNPWNTVSGILIALLILGEAFAALRIRQLEMLPGKYFLILLGAMVIFPLLLLPLMFRKNGGKYQKRSGNASAGKIIAYILCIAVTALCLLGSGVIGQVNDALSAITNTTVNVIMNIYVPAEDPAHTISEAAGYTFGIVGAPEDGENSAALADIEEALGTAVATQSYDSPFAMVDGLYAGQVQAILLENGYVDILEGMESYADFGTRVRLLYEHVSKKELSGGTAGEGGTVSIKGDITNTPFLLYISGNDARLPMLADGGSDVNILLAVNPVSKQVLLVNTPRDYYVVNPDSGELRARDKLSHCGLKGIDNCIGALNDLYGMDINYYARINFSGFRTLIDALGGVTIHADFGFTAGEHYIHEGENHLNGAQALAFARERKNLAGGDNDRGKNQMKLIAAMINQLSAGNLLANYGEILGSLEGMFATSLSTQEIAKLVKMQLGDMASWDIRSFAVTGDNGNDKCWAVNNGYGYVMYPHQHMVDHAVYLMEKVLAGDVLTDEDMMLK